MVLISDGADTASDHSLIQALEDIRRSDALVYAIAIDSVDARESTRVNPEALREITSLTGGYTEVVRMASDLGPATARIADELNKQVHARIQLVPPARWDVACHPRARPRRSVHRARPARLLRPPALRNASPLTRRPPKAEYLTTKEVGYILST